MKRIRFVLLAVWFGLPSVVSADDFAVMRTNLREQIMLGGAYDGTDVAVQKHVATIASNAGAYQNSLEKHPVTYLWSDYNKLKGDATYSCKHIYYSLQRLHTMALAWAYPTSALYHDTDLLTNIKSSLDFLYDYALNEQTSLIGNFWEWRIGMPQEYAAIVSILYEELSPSQIAKYENSFKYFVRQFANTGNLTYANQADICRNLLYMGILTGNATDIADCLAKVKRAFVDETTMEERKKAQALFEQMIVEQGDYHNYNGVLKKEGFYPDGTFIQHTAIPYIGGYGASLIRFTAEMQLCLAGTEHYSAPDWFYDIMPVWMEKAFIPAIYKGEMMRMFMGRNMNGAHSSHETARTIGLNMYLSRGLVRDEALRKRIVDICKTWYTENNYYETMYDGMNPIVDKPHINQLVAEGASVSSDVFNIVLAAGDRVIHETRKFRFGLAMSSNRIGKFEGFSNNNMSGWYTGDGMTYIYTPDHRDHWLLFFDKCNFYRMPGTTVDKITRTADGAPIALFDNPVNAQSWVGGISLQGRYGAAGMSHVGAKSDLVAKKSWFMFDDEIYCMGAGISMSENRNVETIIESRYIQSGWTIDGSEGTTKKCAEVTYTNPKYAYINDVGGYVFPADMTLTTYIEQNRMYSLYIDHGKAPQQEAYEYILLPQMAAGDVAAYAQAPAVRKVVNSDSVQAVWHQPLDIVGINFWQTGKTASVYSDGEASVMLRHSNDTLYFAAADPTWKRTRQTFVLDGVYTLIDAMPEGQVTVDYTASQTTIMVDCADRMGQGQQIVLKTRQRMPDPATETALHSIQTQTNCKKYIQNGQLFIRYGSHTYNALGQTVL